MAHVFNKILGRKDKGLDVFLLPEKKYCRDAKKWAKMERKDLLDELEQMEKYITVVCGKLQQGKKEYERSLDKVEEQSQKLNVVNSKMAMISNEHEQLQVKFTNLQNSLQIMTKEKQQMFKAELQFIQTRELGKEKVADLAAVLKIYKEQIMLVDKIAHQNKQLKIKYSQLETEFFSLSEKISEAKAKTEGEEGNEAKNSGKSREETEPDDNSQFKLMLEAKEQMIVVLNKKIGDMEEKTGELAEAISELNHQVEKRNAEIKQKGLDVTRLHSENNEFKRKIEELKEFHEQLLVQEQEMKEEIADRVSELESLKQEVIDLKHKLKLSQEEKRIIIGSQTENLINSEHHEKQKELERTQFEHLIQSKDRELENVRMKLEALEKEKSKLEGIIVELKSREKDAVKTKQNLVEQTKLRVELQKKLQDQQQNYQIKLKKLEFTANQQRIKAESLKRSLTNLQQKEQENRKQLDEMYQKKVVQDSKLAKMENKLKHYKQTIQYLQKEKVELEKTYEDKMKNMEEVVLHDVEEEDVQASSEPSEHEIVEKDEAMISKLNSKIVDLEEEIQFLKEENRRLASKKDELEESNLELEKNFRVINEKRQEMIREFSKMNSLGGNVAKKPSKPEEKPVIPGRDKKIAEKALKGFDIFSKHLSTLYKQFLNVHLGEIERKEVKELEGQINALVGRCEDMKDIFQGYL